MFERWGRFVYRRRWFVLAGAALMFGVSIAAILAGGGSDAPHYAAVVESDRAASLVARELPQDPSSSSDGSSLIFLFSSPDLTVDDPTFRATVEGSASRLQADPRVTRVTTPYAGSGSSLVSRDRHQAIVLVGLKDRSRVAEGYLGDLRREVGPSALHVVMTGDVPINHAFNTTLETDLQRAELVSLPVALLLLVLIFRSVVAATLPLAIGVVTIAGGVAGTLLVSHLTYVSQYAFNIVTLVGLGVSIDYSLMFVSRFREEIASGASREEAVATSMATAGRAMSFSGLAVAVGLSSLLFFQGTSIPSLGIAGAIVVSVAVVYGLTLLPAMLAVLGPRINWLGLPWRRPRSSRGFWFGIAGWVMRRPLVVLVPTVALLLAAGIPFTHLRLAATGVDSIPPGNEARQGYDTLVRDFAGYGNNEIGVVAYFPNGSPTTGEGPADIAALSDRLQAITGVVEVDPPVIGRHIALVRIVSNLDASSDGARAIVNGIRAQPSLPGGGRLLVYGDTASDLDLIAFVRSHLLTAMAFVLAITYVVLLLMTRSAILPLKAVTTNLMSIAASFGALVWIFQDGHLSGLLNFSAQSIDPTIPVILFALVFGLSMDYEVFLLARIQERWHRTHDSRTAIAEGLERSGRLITGAAAIMVAVFLAFGLADDVLIKSIGIGIAIAIAIDATLIRALVVPAVMRLLGTWNWWAPRPIRRMGSRALQSEAPA
jgi:RND superfamily putative drug exporter